MLVVFFFLLELLETFSLLLKNMCFCHIKVFLFRVIKKSRFLLKSNLQFFCICCTIFLQKSNEYIVNKNVFFFVFIIRKNILIYLDQKVVTFVVSIQSKDGLKIVVVCLNNKYFDLLAFSPVYRHYKGYESR